MENKKLEIYITDVLGMSLKAFASHPFSMQGGVYLEFFDSHNIIITIGNQYQDWKCQIVYSANDSDFFRLEVQSGLTREATLINAIKKAFEILELAEAGKKGAKAGEEMRDNLLGK